RVGRTLCRGTLPQAFPIKNAPQLTASTVGEGSTVLRGAVSGHVDNVAAILPRCWILLTSALKRSLPVGHAARPENPVAFFPRVQSFCSGDIQHQIDKGDSHSTRRPDCMWPGPSKTSRS